MPTLQERAVMCSTEVKHESANFAVFLIGVRKIYLCSFEVLPLDCIHVCFQLLIQPLRRIFLKMAGFVKV
jgi:hypothetical protein